MRHLTPIDSRSKAINCQTFYPKKVWYLILFPERYELKKGIWLTERTCIDAPESQTLSHNNYSSRVNHLFLKEDQCDFTHYIV